MPRGLFASPWIDEPWNEDAQSRLDLAVHSAGLRSSSRLRTSTSYLGDESEIEVVKCREPYHCVSRVKKFGREHYGDIDPAKVDALDDKNTEDYEWRCPHDEQWSLDMYDQGSADDPELCGPGDCKCVAPASNQGEGTISNGQEKFTGDFEVMTENADFTKRERMTIVPHYYAHLFKGSVDPEKSPYGYLGAPVYYPRDFWLNTYKASSGKSMQLKMDKLHDSIDKVMKIVDEKMVPDATGGMPLIKDFMPKELIVDTLAWIRGFNVLSKDCVKLRDTAEKLAGSAEEQVFSAAGKHHGQLLNCFHVPGSNACQQLNCYTDDENISWQQDMLKLKHQLMNPFRTAEENANFQEDADTVVNAIKSPPEVAVTPDQSSCPNPLVAALLLPGGLRTERRAARDVSRDGSTFL